MKSLITKKSPIKDYRLVRVTCQRCGYNWQPIIEKRPRKCPDCQCRKWDNYKPPKKSQEIALNQPSPTKEALKR